jgi:hypothetical protein
MFGGTAGGGGDGGGYAEDCAGLDRDGSRRRFLPPIGVADGGADRVADSAWEDCQYASVDIGAASRISGPVMPRAVLSLLSFFRARTNCAFGRTFGSRSRGT